jgi:hypothetical protein
VAYMRSGSRPRTTRPARPPPRPLRWTDDGHAALGVGRRRSVGHASCVGRRRGREHQLVRERRRQGRRRRDGRARYRDGEHRARGRLVGRRRLLRVRGGLHATGRHSGCRRSRTSHSLLPWSLGMASWPGTGSLPRGGRHGHRSVRHDVGRRRCLRRHPRDASDLRKAPARRRRSTQVRPR